METTGASVVINHHIKKGRQRQYEQWLDEIGPVCRSWRGNIDWQIVRPIEGLSFSYTIIIRFDTIENLKSWMESGRRRELIEKAAPLFEKGDNFFIRSGLDFLFTDDSQQKTPVRWKQYLVTWSAIYPLSLLIPMLLQPVFEALALPENRLVRAFLISAAIVYIMVYWLMPRYTRLVKKWLYQ